MGLRISATLLESIRCALFANNTGGGARGASRIGALAVWQANSFGICSYENEASNSFRFRSFKTQDLKSF
jgi:hypothetical protein